MALGGDEVIGTKERPGSHFRSKNEVSALAFAQSGPVAEGKRRRRYSLEVYEETTSRPMFLLALLFLAIYSFPILDVDLSSGWRMFCSVLSWFIWIAFAADLTTRIYLSDDRWRYVASHPVDVLAVALPALRPLRVLRVFTAGQALLCGTGRYSLTTTTKAIVMAAMLLVFIGAVAVLDAERGAPGATIDNPSDAMWWSAGRLTSVSVGSAAPVTGAGKAIAIGLALVSVSVIGAFAAAVAAWFVGQSKQVNEQKQDESAERLRRMEVQLNELHRSLSTIDLDKQTSA